MGCASILIPFNKTANKIKVVTIEEVAECSNLGNISVNTLGNFGKKVGRNREKVAIELEGKAIWRAAQLNATNVVPLTQIGRKGNQTYAAYVCSEPLSN